MSDLMCERLRSTNLSITNEAADLIEQLQQRNAELAAHVERLCEKITEYHSEDVAAEDALNDLAVIVADIPNQSLAERDAEDVEKFIDNELRSACLANGWDTESSAYQVSIMLEQYASQLREQSDE